MGEKRSIEKWDLFEIELTGPVEGNPFIDVNISAEFRNKHRCIKVEGFYDGDGIYRVRFMPDDTGDWNYITKSDCKQLAGKKGVFYCEEPSKGNHGPVRVEGHHFAYEDGNPFMQVGTTCYVWNHQGDELEEKTLQTLKDAPFNKLRMCVFPKRYDFNKNEPEYYPFTGSLEAGWDFTRFNPEFFRHLEKRIQDLLELGIEADLILFHPYDNGQWGFDRMDKETDNRYLRYLIARLAAYRNIWWSMANEYDLMEDKTMQDWDRFFKIVQKHDPYQHLRSVHNCHQFYDHNKPWVTHASIQRPNPGKSKEWRKQYQKPLVIDECCYEGNIHHGWGNITAREMVHRFWAGFSNGGYVGHGETYIHPEDILWWSKGGVLHGESPVRIKFLKEIMEEMGPVDPVDGYWDVSVARNEKGDFIFYFGNRQPSYYYLDLSGKAEYTIDVIDTWEMTITNLKGNYSGKCKVELPAKPYIALCVKPITTE